MVTNAKPPRDLTAWTLALALALTVSACAPTPEDSEGGESSSGTEEAISQHLAAAQSTGPGAEARYEQSLQRLRGNGAQVMRRLVPLYMGTPPQTFGKRFTLVHLMSELERDEAVDPLLAIASAPMPERAPAPPAGSTVGHDDGDGEHEREAIIRGQAIDGLYRLARARRGKALESLRSLLRRPGRDQYVPERAALALRRLAVNPVQVQALRLLLPANLQWVASARFPRAGELQQPRLAAPRGKDRRTSPRSPAPPITKEPSP